MKVTFLKIKKATLKKSGFFIQNIILEFNIST